VCQQVTAQTGTVIPPATPAEETFQAEFITGIRTDIPLQVVRCHIIGIFLDAFFRSFELFPVDCVGRSAVYQRIYPRPVRVVTVGTYFDQRYFADQAFVDDLLGTDITVGLTSLMPQLENDAGFFYHLAHLISLRNCPRQRFFHIDMLSGFSCFHRHRTVPMIGSSDNNCVDVIGRQQFFICSVTFRAFTELSVRTFAMNIGCCQNSRFTIHIEDIAYAGYFDIQIILLQELLVTLVLAIVLRPFNQAVDPGRFGKTGCTHQLLAADTETDHSDTNLFPVRLGRNHIMFFIKLKGTTQTFRLFVVRLFLVDTITQCPQYRNGSQRLQGITTSFRLRPLIFFRSIIIVFCCHDITLI